MSTVALIARLVLAAALAVAGAAKLVDPGRSESLVRFGLPRRLALPVGTLLPVAELAIAGALLPRTSAWWGAWAALALLVAFSVGISFNLARGRAPDCHCFGQLRVAPIGRATLLRNLALVAIAVLVVARGETRVGPSATAWVSGLSGAAWAGVAGGFALLFALATGARLLFGLIRSHGELLIRIDGLEARLAEQGFVLATRDPGRPLGLTVGQRAPTFEAQALDGSLVTLAQVRTPGLPLLLVFVDPGCGPCEALLPRVGAWQRDHADRVAVALVSRGSRDVNHAQTAEHGIGNVLLQQEHEVAHAYEVPGAPGAVLVGPSGNIASPVVMGAEAIEQLLASVIGASEAVDSAGGQRNDERASSHLRISRVP